jgi:hypothetical protein
MLHRGSRQVRANFCREQAQQCPLEPYSCSRALISHPCNFLPMRASDPNGLPGWQCTKNGQRVFLRVRPERKTIATRSSRQPTRGFCDNCRSYGQSLLWVAVTLWKISLSFREPTLALVTFHRFAPCRFATHAICDHRA